MRSVLLCERPESVKRVFPGYVLEKLEKEAGADAKTYTKADVAANADGFGDVEYIFSTWGMPVFTDEEIGRFFPRLKCVFYAAGTVQAFARPFLERGIKVFSAWGANGVPVAEYTSSLIILANKGFFRTTTAVKSTGYDSGKRLSWRYPGNFHTRVGIVGAGMIGKKVINLLRACDLDISVFDPFLSDETAKSLGVVKTDLKTLFSACRVVSNHLANNDATAGMIGGELFKLMPENATFINTGRGRQIVESELCAVLAERPDLTAILDVTYPEPPEEGSPLYKLSNCILSPHIAGSTGGEVKRMAEYMLREFEDFIAGKETKYEVNLKMHETMA